MLSLVLSLCIAVSAQSVDDTQPEQPAQASPAERLGWIAASVGGGTAAGLGAAIVSVVLVEGLVALGTAGFIGFIGVRQGGFTAADAQSLPVDALLYFLLFSMIALGPAVMLAVASDAVAFGVVSALVPPWSARNVVAAIVSACASIPALLVAALGGAVLLVWLSVQQLPDVLMLVGLGALGVAAVLLAASVIVVRPLVTVGTRYLSEE